MIILGLGSNLGSRSDNIINALNFLSANNPIIIQQVSSLYETAPIGFLSQPPFLNAVAEIQTSLEPFSLLEACLQTEKLMGRIRDIRWGPRIIDIDLLFYHNVKMQSETLILPHPCLHERRFVLQPLAEITSDILVGNGQTIAELLAQLANNNDVRLYKKLLLEGGEVRVDGTG